MGEYIETQQKTWQFIITQNNSSFVLFCRGKIEEKI